MQHGDSSEIDVEMIPVVGEIADGINGAVSLARGNYAEAAMSFAAMIPMAGSAATVTKWGKKLVDKADKVATAAKNLYCKVTRGLCFDAETELRSVRKCR